jgi:peptide/nickel transport system permease protein
MFAYVIRKLMYMPFILLGVIFITFVLFQMSTTPEALAKIQLGEKASARQIYEYLSSKGQVNWTDEGQRKRSLLAAGKLENKRTEFFVRQKLEDMAARYESLREDALDLHKDIAAQTRKERAGHLAGSGAGGEAAFKPSQDLVELTQELGRLQKKQIENRHQIEEALLGARRVEAAQISGLTGDVLEAVLHTDAISIALEFAKHDLEDIQSAGYQAKETVTKLDAELVEEAGKTDGWDKYQPVRTQIAGLSDVAPDLEYRAWYVNFAFYLRDILLLDFGDTNKKRPVTEVIAEGMWPSLALAIPGFFLAELIGVFFGLLAAMYRQSKVDHVIVISAILLMSINGIALIMFGQKILAANWNYFPITGYAEGFGALRYLMLPILLYVIITFGERVRFNRIVMLDETNQDYVRTARAKGLSENTVLFKHILRNTLIPLITRWVVAIPSLYLGSLVLESFFGIPGLGFLTVEAIANSDANVIRAVVVFGSVSFMLAALVSDVLYAVVDPRVKLS